MALEVGDTTKDDPPPPPSAVPSIAASIMPSEPNVPGGSYGSVPDVPLKVADASSGAPSIASQFQPPQGMSADEYQDVVQDDADIQREKIGLQGALFRDMQRRDAFNANRQNDMFEAQMATGRELRPWDAKTEMASRKHDLWEQFGSPGFLISMMASSFTAMPMVSALNGGAAAMNAINAGDMAAYDQAFEAWKVNTDLVLKRMDIEQRAFQDLNQLRQTDMAAWRDKTAAVATMYNDERTLNLLDHGFDAEVIKAQEGLADLRINLASADKALRESNTWSMVVTGNPDWPYGFDGNLKPEFASGERRPDPEKMQHIIQATNAALDPNIPTTAEGLGIRTLVTTPGFFDQKEEVQRKQINEMLSGMAAARNTGKGGVVNRTVQGLIDADAAAHPERSPEEAAHAAEAIHLKWLGNVRREQMNPFDRAVQEEIDKSDAAVREAGTVETPEEEGERHRKIMRANAQARKPPSEGAIQKQLSDPRWLASPEGQKWIATQPPDVQAQYHDFIKRYSKGMEKFDLKELGWSQDAIDSAAEVFNQTGIKPSYLGAKQYGTMIMGAITSRAMEMMKEKYPELKDDNRALVEKRVQQWQNYHTEQVALNRYNVLQQGQTITSLNVVVQHLQVLKELKEAQEEANLTGNWTTFQRISNWWAKEFGSQVPTNADMAAVIVGNELVKAIQRGNLGTGEERQEAEAFFSKIRSKDQIDGAIETGTKLLVGQLRAMKYGFMASTHRPGAEFDRILMPETRAYFSAQEIRDMKPDNSGDYKGIPGYDRAGGGTGKSAPVIELDPIR